MEDLGELNSPLLGNKNEEEDDIYLEEQIKKKLREGFTAKVFGIVAYQMVILFLVVLLGFINSTFREWLLSSTLLYILAIIITFTSLFIPIFSPVLFRAVPTNYIILTIFTISYSWIIATFTVQFSANSVLTALFLTIIMVLCLTIYAFWTKSDYTVLGGTLFTALTLLIISSILLIFIRIELLYMIYIYAGLIIFCIYLLYDVQLLIGKGEHKFGEDDYILAALNLYLDIIGIFVRILAIFGTKDN